jgi:AcrR family transcriptional regulator
VNIMPTDTRTRILEGALDLLRSGGAVSLESAAERAGLTKPGLMYHFSTKEALMVGLVDHVVDRWETELTHFAGADAKDVPVADRIRAYAEFALATDFDESDMVILSDPRLRQSLCSRWEQRMADWVVLPDDLPEAARGSLLAVRLLADGAWFASAANVLAPDRADRDRVLMVVRELLKAAE